MSNNPKCPRCDSTATVKDGYNILKTTKERKQKYRCNTCDKSFLETTKPLKVKWKPYA